MRAVKQRLGQEIDMLGSLSVKPDSPHDEVLATSVLEWYVWERKRFYAELVAVCDELEALRTRLRWTPVTEGLPKEMTEVLVIARDWDGLGSSPWIGSVQRGEWCLVGADDGSPTPEVTHWKEVGGEENEQ